MSNRVALYTAPNRMFARMYEESLLAVGVPVIVSAGGIDFQYLGDAIPTTLFIEEDLLRDPEIVGKIRGVLPDDFIPPGEL